MGPSTPLTPILFRYGIETLGGMLVRDPDFVVRGIREGGDMDVFRRGGLMVQLTAAGGTGQADGGVAPPAAPRR